MTTAAARIRRFVAWADKEGRDSILGAMIHSGYSPEGASASLDDHLSTLRNLGIVVGSPRVNALVGYARGYANAPIPSDSDMQRLHSPTPWPLLDEEQPQA